MVAPILVQTVQASASLAACYLFSSLYRDIRTVRITKTTGKMPLLPLTSMFGNCVLWCFYGFLAGDYFPIFLTNGVGVGFSTFYLAVYYQYTPLKKQTRRILIAMVMALFLVAMYPVFSFEPRDVVQRHVGYMAMAVCAIMFGSPLVLLKQVIQTKNADVLPFGMIMAGLINSLLWLTYGLILNDPIVILPNLLNLCLGLVQFALILFYPRTKGYGKVDASRESEDIDVAKVELTKPAPGASIDETSSTDETLSDV